MAKERAIRGRREVESILAVQKTIAPLPRLLGRLAAWNIEYYGQHNIPRDQPVVIAASHQNSWDAHTLGYAYYDWTGLPLSMLAKEELFEIPLAAPVIRSIGGIGIDRSGQSFNRDGYKTARGRLLAGAALGACVEGTRTHGGNIGEIKTGVLTIAKHLGLDVVTAGGYGPSPKSPYLPRPMTWYFGSRTNPADIENPAEFYREQIQHDFNTALALHHGRPLPKR